MSMILNMTPSAGHMRNDYRAARIMPAKNIEPWRGPVGAGLAREMD